MKQGNVLNRVHDMYKDFHMAECRVADFVVGQPDKVLRLNVSELAEACNTSDATIIRFSKKLGYSGYYQLKINLAKERGEANGGLRHVLEASSDIAVNTIFMDAITKLQTLNKMIDYNHIKKCAELICSCENVYFVATGNTIPVALDASYRFNVAGIRSYAASVHEYMLAYVNLAREKDIVLAISQSGSSKAVLTYVKLANEHGVTTIGITGHSRSPLSAEAKHCIFTPANEGSYMEVFRSSKLCENTVIDLLLYTVIEMNREASVINIDKIENIVSETKY